MKSIVYAQNGEDILLNRFFAGMWNGFYIDVGASDPVVYSVTKFFTTRGWRGINIDANPDALPRFDTHRPRDINLNAAVGDEGPPRSYFKFDDRLLNGFLAPEIIARYSATINEIVREPHVVETAASQGIVTRGGAPDQLAAFLARDIAVWRQVVKEAGIRAE